MRRLCAAGLLFTCAMLAPLAAVAEETNLPEDPGLWAPADAVLFLAVDDVSDLAARWKKMAGWKMASDEDLKSLPGNFSLPFRIAEQFRERLAEALDLEPEQLQNPFAGSFVLYASDIVGDKPQVVAVIGVGDEELMTKYYRRVTGRFRELADEHEKIEFRSFTIDSFTTEHDEEGEGEDDEEGDELEEDLGDPNDLSGLMDRVLGEMFSPEAMPERLAMCLTPKRLIVAPTPDMIKAVLRRDGSSTLCDNELYKHLRRRFKPAGQIRLLLDIQTILEAVVQEGGEKTAESIKMLGLDGMRGVVAHMDYLGEGYESRMEAELLVTKQRRGLVKIFSMPNTPVKLPPFAVDNAFVFGTINLDIMELLDEVERMIRVSDPATADTFRQSLEAAPLGDEEMNLRKELFAHLKAPMTFSMGFSKPYNARSTKLLFTIAVRELQPLQAFLEKLAELAAGMLVDREIGGTFIYDISMGGFSIAASNEAVLVGSTPCVEKGLNRSQQTSDQIEGFNRLARLVPPDASCVVYSDSRRLYEGAIELAAQKEELMAQFGDPGAMITGMLVESLIGDVPPERLDKAKAILKYQAQSLMAIRTTSDGIYLISVQTPPEGSKEVKKAAKSE